MSFILKMGESSNLDNVPIKNGNILYTTDNNKLYIDTSKRNLVAQSYGLATTESAGLMSAEDKALLIKLEAGSTVPISHTLILTYNVTVPSYSQAESSTVTVVGSNLPEDFNPNGYFDWGSTKYSFTTSGGVSLQLATQSFTVCSSSNLISQSPVATYERQYDTYTITPTFTYKLNNNLSSFNIQISTKKSYEIVTETGRKSEITYPYTKSNLTASVNLVYYV